jgi:hypothetical protein
MKIIAQFEQTVQVSEDSWRVIRQTLFVTSDTNVGQILEWAKRIHSNKVPNTIELLHADEIKQP